MVLDILFVKKEFGEFTPSLLAKEKCFNNPLDIFEDRSSHVLQMSFDDKLIRNRFGKQNQLKR